MSKVRSITSRLMVPALIAGSVFTLGAPVKWHRVVEAITDLLG